MDDLLPLLDRYRLTLVPTHLALSPIPGEWESPYRGHGPEHIAFREFVPGDDVRLIHPGISSRMGKKMVSERAEQRDVVIAVFADFSPSMFLQEKSETQRRVAAMLLYSAWKAETTFALCVLGEDIWNRAGTGERQFSSVYRMLSERSLEPKAGRASASFAGLDRNLRTHLPPQSMVFILSDFLGDASLQKQEQPLLRALAQRYDVTAVCLQNELEFSFPAENHRIFSLFRDAETGQRREILLSSKDQVLVRRLHEDRFAEEQEIARGSGMDWIHCATPSMPELYRNFSQFFDRRKR